MDLPRLIAALSEPDAYPTPVRRVDVRQTHISVAFLAGEHVYKIKKPVYLGFLDFSTLEKRRHFCEEEVRLNLRLAPDVYLGVVPITRRGDSVAVEGDGELVEWAVKMQRLPDDATLLRRLENGKLDEWAVTQLAATVAEFHQQAEATAEAAAFGHFNVVAGNARENFEQSTKQVGKTVSPAVMDRLRDLTEAELFRLWPVIEARAERGVPRDTHGDLHLDHVYLVDRGSRIADLGLKGPTFKPKSAIRLPPSDQRLVIIDCIEFNERFRFADPVADMAFVVMDLIFHGRRDLARTFAEAYFAATGDTEGRDLLPFYVAYRAAVRAKVDGIKAASPEVPETSRTAAQTRARAHWLLALGELAGPVARPGLVLVGGLPGTGKSTLARTLADRAGFTVIRSDVIRKELARRPPTEPTPAERRSKLYSARFTDRTYAECCRRAEEALLLGHRVIVDATFPDDVRRQQFLSLAARLAVPAAMFLCQADHDTVRKRLAERQGDASDADWSIYAASLARWQDPGAATRALCDVFETNGPVEALTEQALQRLTAREMWR